MKRLAQTPRHPVAKDKVWREALLGCLGDAALDLKSLADRKSRTLGGDMVPLGLGDFFFDTNDPLHPDREEDEEN
jgi:hypothetical protein